MLSKYLRRPATLELISESQFSKMDTIAGLNMRQKKLDFYEDEYD